jgi:hypothetical protein
MHTVLPEAAAHRSPTGDAVNCSTQAEGMGNDSVWVPVKAFQRRT